MSSDRGLICVAVGAPTPADLPRLIAPVRAMVDVVEVRLDLMEQPDVSACLLSLPDMPLLFTNRPQWEGGRFQGSEAQRISLLTQAVEGGADYLDVELATAPGVLVPLLEAAAAARAMAIVSSHNFQDTPPSGSLRLTVDRMIASGAAAGKIVTTAHHSDDVLRVLALLAYAGECNFPLSAFCMGEAGRISRFATLYLGGFMSYVALDRLQATAPGQLSAHQVHSLIHCFEDHGD